MKIVENFYFPVVTEKYRGTTEYSRVRELLVRAAESRGLTTYGEIAVIMGLPTQGNHMSNGTGHLLGEISEEEKKADRPMLSAVVVTVDGTPGSGFFKLAKKLGKFKGEAVDEDSFWRQELEAVYEACKRPTA